MKHHAFSLSVLLLALLPLFLPVAAAENNHAKNAHVDYGPVKEAVSELIRKEMKKSDVTGLSIALVDDQQVVWSEGFGYADEDKEVSATPETVYRIGSLTMLFTATAAMQLAEQGTIDIDRPVKNYLPEFSVRSRFSNTARNEITIRQLLTHHSGLPSNILSGLWSGAPEPYTSVLGRLKDEYVAYPPDYLFSYSSVGMTLVGQIVERASGQEYVSYISKALLQPMGMTHTGFALTAGGLLSKGYHKGKEIQDPLVRDVPAGSMLSSVADLSRFMRMMFNQGRANGNRILKPETLAEMLRPQNEHVPLDLGLTVGLGWMLSGFGDIDIRNAGTVAHQAGATLLFHSQLIMLPEHRLGVVVLSNSSTSGRVVNKVAVQAILQAFEAKTGVKQPKQQKPVEVNAPLPQEVVREYAGQYASLGGLAEIKSKTDHFHAEVMNRTFQLTPCEDKGFSIQYLLFGLFPIRLGELDYYELARADIAGREVLLARTKGRELIIAEKIQAAPVPDAWRKRAGEYRIENLGNDFPLLEHIRLRYQDGLLLAECEVPFFFKGIARFPLAPVSDLEAIVAGLGRGMGETIRIEPAGGREMLRYGGYLFSKRKE